MLTIKQILANTPRDRLFRSQYVLLSGLQFRAVKFDKDKNIILPPSYEVRTQTRLGSPMPQYERGKVYKTSVVSLDGRIPINNGHVRVSCGCPDYLFTWEVALHKYGAADIIYSNGEYPEIKNPLEIPGVCLAKGTLVQTISGLVPIEDVEVGTEVLTMDGYAHVSTSGLTASNAPTLKFGTTLGYELECTPGHEVLAWTRKSVAPEWVKAQSLKIGDIIVRYALKERNLSVKERSPAVKNWKEPAKYAMSNPITSITPGRADVYDLTVPGPQHFTANGFVVHNCKHLAAFLIYLRHKGL